MQIRVKREDLIRQLPYLKLQLIMEHDEGEYIFIIGEELWPGGHPLEQLIPSFMEIFTETEFSLLKEMYGHSYVPLSILAQHTHGFSLNSVDVHVKNIRRKIEKYALPLVVQTPSRYGRSLRIKRGSELVIK